MENPFGFWNASISKVFLEMKKVITVNEKELFSGVLSKVYQIIFQLVFLDTISMIPLETTDPLLIFHLL